MITASSSDDHLDCFFAGDSSECDGRPRFVDDVNCGPADTVGGGIEHDLVVVAPDEASVREHAKQGGFPANRVSAVRRMIDPTSAEG